MSPFYLAVIVLSASILIGVLLFPFWKFCSRLKAQHPALWQSRGPFGLMALLSESARITELLALVRETAASLPAAQNDRKLLTWARISDGLWGMAPRGFLSQVIFAMVFIYFTWFLSSLMFKIAG